MCQQSLETKIYALNKRPEFNYRNLEPPDFYYFITMSTFNGGAGCLLNIFIKMYFKLTS